MPAAALSSSAIELLRQHIERDGIPVNDGNREAHRELAVAGIMFPVSGFASGAESHYRFTKEGWERRFDWIEANRSKDDRVGPERTARSQK
jgi:hypothetical protein